MEENENVNVNEVNNSIADKESVNISNSSPKSNDKDTNESSSSQQDQLPPIRRPTRTSLNKFQTYGRRVATIAGIGRKFRGSRTSSSECLTGIEENGLFSDVAKPRVKEDFINQINLENLPRKPRFTAQLSAESQYAIFDGYDRLLHKMVVESDSDYSSLKRLAALDIPDMRSNKMDFDFNQVVQIVVPQSQVSANRKVSKVGRRTSTMKRSSTSNSPTPQLPNMESVEENSSFLSARSSPCYSPGPGQQTGRTSVSSRRESTVNRSSQQQPKTSRLAPIEPQIMSSYRLQNAMDICDYLRDRQDEPVLSKRYERYYIEPRNHYILWSVAWKKAVNFKERSADQKAAPTTEQAPQQTTN